MSEENSGSENQGDSAPGDFSLSGSNDEEGLKPPDSKKFQLELDKVIAEIRDKESSLRSLEKHVSSTADMKTNRRDKETLKSELENLRAKREKEIQARKQIDIDLKGLNTQVLKKNDSCTKLQAGLRYKSETRIDEAVRKLEYQMQVQQLKLSEEKRIVAEIDMLRRTKRNLNEYLVVKQDVEQLRRKQKIARSQRDACVKRISALKSKEEEIKTLLDAAAVEESSEAKFELKEQLNEIEALKKEIEELQNTKKTLRANFTKERNEFKSAMKETRIQRQREETARKRNERLTLPKEVFLMNRARKEPFETEKAQCDKLIAVMERLHLGAIHQSPVQDTQVAVDDTPFEFLPGFANSFSCEEGVFLRRKSATDDLVGVYAGLGKMSRRGSRKGRRSSAKEAPRKLNLHAHVVENLLSLGLSLPSTVADIPKVLEELQEKKDFYETAKFSQNTQLQNNDFMSPITEESTPGFPENAESRNVHEVSMVTETGATESSACNALDIQESVSDLNPGNMSEISLVEAAAEVQDVSANDILDNPVKIDAVESSLSAYKGTTSENEGNSITVTSIEHACANGVYSTESSLPEEGCEENAVEPTLIINTFVESGLESGNITGRTERKDESSTAATNCIAMLNEEDRVSMGQNNVSNEAQLKTNGVHNDSTYSSVLKKNIFCKNHATFGSQETLSKLEEKCPA